MWEIEQQFGQRDSMEGKSRNSSQETLKLSPKDIDKILKDISRIVARGNILLQTGRITMAKDLEQQKKEVMTYEF